MPTFADFARSNLHIRYCFPGARILGCKADVNGAFEHCWLHPKHVGDLAAEIDGYTTVNLVEVFGHGVAPTKNCSRAEVISQIHNHTGDGLTVPTNPCPIVYKTDIPKEAQPPSSHVPSPTLVQQAPHTSHTSPTLRPDSDSVRQELKFCPFVRFFLRRVG